MVSIEKLPIYAISSVGKSTRLRIWEQGFKSSMACHKRFNGNNVSGLMQSTARYPRPIESALSGVRFSKSKNVVEERRFFIIYNKKFDFSKILCYNIYVIKNKK